jgi:hypothetical protein
VGSELRGVLLAARQYRHRWLERALAKFFFKMDDQRNMGTEVKKYMDSESISLLVISSTSEMAQNVLFQPQFLHF